MSFPTFVNLALLSAVLALGQWVVFKIMSKGIGYLPLFGSLLASNVIIILVRGMFR